MDELLDVSALLKKGKLNNKDKQREDAEAFTVARQKHPAVECAINNLERLGLERVRTHGRDGLRADDRAGSSTANLHRIGLILQRRERDRL